MAFAWIATEAFGAAAGYLIALGPLVLLATLVLGGRVADGLPPGRAMIGADLVRAAALLGVVAAWSVQGSPPAAGLVLTVAALGAGQAVFRPALQAVLPALVPDRTLLPAANALLDGTERLARLLGPALAGLLSALLPLRHLLTLDAVTFLLSATALWLIQRRQPIPALHGLPPGGMLASMAQGVRALRRQGLLGYVLATCGMLNGAWYATFFLVLPLLLQRSGLALSSYGLVISAYGLTNLAANLVIGSRPMPRRPGRQIFGGNLCLALGMASLAASAAAGLQPGLLLPAAMAASGLAAIGGPMQDIPIAVLRQTELARADVPAATRAMMASSQGGQLAGVLLTPLLLGVLPVAGVIALCAVLVAGIALLGLRRHGGNPEWRSPGGPGANALG